MKYLTAIFFILVLATLACTLEFNPPPLSMTPPAAEATIPPVILMATPTFTSLPPTASQPAPELPLPVSDTPSPIPEASAANPALTIDQLRNATLTLMGSDQNLRTISLQDGKYEEGTDPAQPGYISVMISDKIAFGDLNQDGFEDAAITIVESYGGTGQFVSVVAILNQEGQPNAVATALIDDRPILNELAIKDGEIFVDATIHGLNDPMCCAALPSTRYYRLIDNALVLSRFSTRIPSGAERIIQIDTPINGTEISGPFAIMGSVTISPFENNLVYTVFLQGTNEPIAQAGFTINADGLGGPGTFELPLDLSTAFKGPIRVEISDVSPADGSYMAINSVYLVLK